MLLSRIDTVLRQENPVNRNWQHVRLLALDPTKGDRQAVHSQADLVLGVCFWKLEREWIPLAPGIAGRARIDRTAGVLADPRRGLGLNDAAKDLWGT